MSSAKALGSSGPNVSGRRVVITGASRGIGRHLAATFANAGAKVALAARNRADLESVAASLSTDTLVCPGDITDPDVNDATARRVVEEWGGLDVWISNAGIATVVRDVRTMPASAWRQILDVNLSGAFLGAAAAARVMGSGSRIILTGSVLGERGRRGFSAYSASKAGLVGLAKVLALDLASSGITANVVQPGFFDSPLAAPIMEDAELADEVLSHTALRRWGDFADLDGTYLFLASASSAFVTGTTITVDGGYLTV